MAAAIVAMTVVFAACSSGTSSKDKTATAGAGANTTRPAGTATKPAGTATAKTTGTPGTVAAGTAASGTPGATTAAGATTVPGTSPVAGSTQVDASGPVGPAPTVSEADQTVAAGAGAGISGGDPNAPQQVVGTVPVPPPGVTPVVDATQIAAPNPPQDGCGSTETICRFIIDMDASTPGIQSSRDVKVGDVFRVAVVFVGVPPPGGSFGGLSAFNFNLNYDRTKLIASTISGGSSTDRNPDLNVPALGGDAVGWSCLPAPEGDLDDPGGIDGDGDPATGQAFLSCFTPATGQASGDLVVAVVEFHAIAKGAVPLRLSDINTSDKIGSPLGQCTGDPDKSVKEVPCDPGTVNVQ